MLSIIGVGLIVIVNSLFTLLQLFAVAITVITDVIGCDKLFTATKDGKFPFPFAGNPIDDVELIQLKLVPATVPLNATELIRSPLQTVMFDG
jgi:hypothetical protein